MSVTALTTAIIGGVVVLAGLCWRLLRRKRPAVPASDPVPGALTRGEVWSHTEALAEHFRACGTATGRMCADQVMIALNEFVCKHESPPNEV